MDYGLLGLRSNCATFSVVGGQRSYAHAATHVGCQLLDTSAYL